MQIDVGVTLIFVGKETRWHLMGEESRRRAKGQQQHNQYRCFLKQHTAPTYVAVSSSLETLVEPIEESPQPAPARLLRTQQQGGQRRAQSERVKCRQENGYGNGDGKLLIKPAGNPRNEGSGHENGGENQRDSNHRARELFHRFQRRVLGSHPFFDVALHALHHDDGVVHYETNRQH